MNRSKGVSSKGFVEFCRMASSRIQQLHVCPLELTDSGFVKASEYLVNLIHFNTANSISASCLLDAAKHLRGLKSLEIGISDSMTEEMVSSLWKSLPNLTRLRLFGVNVPGGDMQQHQYTGGENLDSYGSPLRPGAMTPANFDGWNMYA